MSLEWQHVDEVTAPYCLCVRVSAVRPFFFFR